MIENCVILAPIKIAQFSVALTIKCIINTNWNEKQNLLFGTHVTDYFFFCINKNISSG